MRRRGAPVRLVGTDDDVRAVAREAARAVATRGDLRREVRGDLAWLHRSRRELVAAVRADEGRSAVRRPGALWKCVWGTVLGAALAATTVSLAMVGPDDRKSRFLDPGLSADVAMPALAVALVAALVVLLVPIPRGDAARVGTGTTVVVGILLAAVLGYRAVVGTSDGRGFTDAQVGPWLAGAGALLALLGALAWRLDRRRRRDRHVRAPRVPGRRDRRSQARWLEERATRLAAVVPRSGEERARLDREWSARLDRIERQGVHADTLAQARTLTPVAWLTWASFDADLDLDGTWPRSLGG